MNSNLPLLRPIRILLFPFSLLYWLVIALRNLLFDRQWLKSARFNLPLICIGNIAVGGTGKSPMTEYLIRLLQTQYRTATLSRGYKRKTRGYVLANDRTTALDIGDEPMQFHSKFPQVAVAVGEERLEAIPQLLHDRPDTQVILLDDAFQHRTVEAGMNIVLTDYSNLYVHDWYLPTGDLRDEKRSVHRAQVIVVTKCPPELGLLQKNRIIESLQLLPEQKVYFTTVQYGIPYHIMAKVEYHITQETEVLLVTGIANPAPLKKKLQDSCASYHQLSYADHHIFSIDDLKEMQARYSQLQGDHRIILTTEKDAVRLIKFQQELTDMSIFVVPIEIKFLFEEGEAFNQQMVQFIHSFHAQ